MRAAALWRAAGRSSRGELRRWRAGVLLVLAWLLVHIGAVQAAPQLELDVVLETSSRKLEVEAVLWPAERDYQFVLHEALQPQGHRTRKS